MWRFIRRLRKCFGDDREGTTAVEYAVMLALILLVCMAGARMLGCSLNQPLLQTVRALAS